jgi:group I intron endonuclease
MGYIYCIRNKVSGKCYIGETMKENVEKRWKQHISLIGRGKGCPALRDAIQKYGIDQFEFTVLVTCDNESRFELERSYIAKYNSQVPNGYNILPGGVGRDGVKHSPESICHKLKNPLQGFGLVS